MSSEELLFKKYWIAFTVIAFLGLSIFVQYRYDKWSETAQRNINTTYNEFIEPQPLSADTAKLVSFGFDKFLSDYYWLQFIQYYGGGDPYGKYRKLPDLFQAVVGLDPDFLYAYQTGLIILPGEGHVDEAIKFGDYGMTKLPDRWEIPYYTGLVYHMYKKDYLLAAKYFEIAAAKPDAPANAKYFSAIYYNKADQKQIAYEIFKTIYDGSTDSFIKERAKKYVDHLSIIFGLQDAVNAYKQKYGKYPTTLDEMVTRKFVQAIPEDPLTIGFTLDAAGQVQEKKK